MTAEWWAPNTSPSGGLPWYLRQELTNEQGTLLVRCFAMLAAFLADELELPVGALPALLRAAIDDYGRTDVAAGIGPGLLSLYEAIRVAFG